MKSNVDLNKLATQIVDACFHVYKEMVPGLLESIYAVCLVKEFELRDLKIKREVIVPLYYKGIELAKDFRIDILVEDEIVVEVKSAEIMHPVYDAQIISYLKLTDKKLGFLVNFNVPLIKNGIKRIVNNF